MANEDSAVTPTVTVVTAHGVKDPDTGIPIELAKGTRLPLSLSLEIITGGALTVDQNGKLLQITTPGTMTLGDHLKSAAQITPDQPQEVITETVIETETISPEQKAAMAKAAKVTSPSDSGSIEMPATVEVDQLVTLPETSDSQIAQLLNETAQTRAIRAELEQKEQAQKEATEKVLADSSFTTIAVTPAIPLVPATPTPAMAAAPAAPPSAPTISAFYPDSSIKGDGVTKSTDIDIEGTGRPGDLIRLLVNEEATEHTTTVGNKGEWSVNWQAPGDGVYTLSAQAVAGGLTSEASESLSIEVDTTPPKLNIDTPEFTVFSLAPIDIIGESTPGFQVDITRDGAAAGHFQPTEDGEWTLALPLPDEAHGHYLYQFSLTDAAGNTTSREVKVQAITAVYDVKVSPDTGTDGDGITNAQNVTVSGKCPPGGIVFLRSTTDGEPVTKQYPCSEDGVWQSDSIHLPASAIYPFEARVQLRDGSLSKAVEFNIERDARAYLQLEIDDPFYTNTNPPVIKGEAEKESSIHGELSQNGTLKASADTQVNSPFELKFEPTGSTRLSDGDYDLKATLTDRADNTATQTRKLILDTQEPPTPDQLNIQATGVKHLDGAHQVPSFNFTVTGVAEKEGHTVRLELPNGVVYKDIKAGDGGVWSQPVAVQDEGRYPIKVFETDLATNTSSVPGLINVTVEGVPLQILGVADQEISAQLKQGDAVIVRLNVSKPAVISDEGVVTCQLKLLKQEQGQEFSVIREVTAELDRNASEKVSKQLVFNYSIQSGDLADAVEVAANSLVMTGGASIQSTLGSPLIPDFTQATFSGLKVDAVKPNTPEITGIVPDTGSDTNDLRTSADEYHLKGKSDPGTEVLLFDHGELLTLGEKIIASTSGLWEVIIEESSKEYKASYTVQSKDSAGNLSDASAPKDVVVDQVKPRLQSLETSTDTATPLKAGSKVTFKLIFDEPVTLTGKPVLKILVGDSIVPLDVEADGNDLTATYTVGEDYQDTDGITAHSLEFTAQQPGETGQPPATIALGQISDLAGNSAETSLASTQSTGVLVDGTKPVITVTLPPATAATQPVISGQCSEAISHLELYVDGQNVALQDVHLEGTEWTAKLMEPLAVDKHYALKAVATDKTGNQGTSDPVDLHIDDTLPYVSVTSEAYTHAKDLKILGTSNILDGTVRFSLQKGQFTDITTDDRGNWKYVLKDAAENTYHVEVEATGSNGRTETDTAQITVDRTEPVFQTAIADIYTSNQPVFSMKLDTAHEHLKNVTLLANSETTLAQYNPATDAWEVTPPTPLVQGEQKIIFTATDLADNVGVREKTINVDSLPPYIELDQACLKSPGLQPELFGKGQNGVTAQLLIKDKVTGELLDSLSQTVSQGTWKVTASKALPSGSYTVQLSAEKAVSDTQTLASKPVEFTLNLQPPSDEPATLAPAQDLLLTLDPIKPWHNLKQAVHLSGQAKTDSLVTVKIDGHDMGGIAAAPNKTWQLSLSPEQLSALKGKEGTLEIRVHAQLGDVEAHVQNVKFGVDTTAPEITLNPPEASGSQYAFGGTYAEDHPYTEALRVLVIDTHKDSKDPSNYIRLEPQLKDNHWKAVLDTSSLPPGDQYTVIVKSKDKAGNATTQKQMFTIETPAEPTPHEPETTPGLGLTLGKCPEWINLQKPLTLSGSAKEGSEVYATIAGHDFGSVTADDKNTWKLKVTPEALQKALSGQKGVKEVLVNAELGEDKANARDQLGIDTTGPVVTLDSYTTTETHHAFSGHFEEAHPFKNGLQIYLVDTDNNPSDKSKYISLEIQLKDTLWNASVEPSAALTPGDHYMLLAKSRDAAGNTSTTKLPFELQALAVKAPEPTETPEPGLPVPINLVLDPLPKLTNLGKTLSVSGQAVAGSLIAVEMGGQSQGSVTTNPNNTWELLLRPEQLKALPEGPLQVNIDASLNGVTDQTSATLTVDKAEPELTLDSKVSTEVTPVFTGTIQEAHPKTFEAKLLNGEGQATDTLTVSFPAEGIWKATGTQPQNAGSNYQLLLTAEDQLGQKSTLQKPCSVEPTTEATPEPQPPVDPGLTLGKPPEWINLQKPLTLSGSAKEGSEIHVYIAGKDLGTTTADAQNTWQKEITPESLQAALAGQEGVKDVLVKATLGEDTTSTQDQLGTDNTGPVVTLDDYKPTETHHEFSGHYDDAHPVTNGLRLYLVDIDKGAKDKSHYIKLSPKLEGNAWSASVEHKEVLTPGNHYMLRAKGRDSVGNESTTELPFELKPLIVTEKPVIELEFTEAPAFSALDDKFEVSGKTTAGSTMAFELGSLKLPVAPVVGQDGLWKVTYADIPETDRKSLPEGPQTFKATASLEGHETSSKEHQVIVDRTAPKISIDHETTVDPAQRFTGTFTEDNLDGISAELIAGDNTKLPLQVTWEGNKWTAIGQHPLTKGTYEFHITVTDKAGTSHTGKEALSLEAEETPAKPLAEATLDPVSLATENTKPVLQGTLSNINHEHLQGLSLELVNKATSEKLALQVEPTEQWNVQVPISLPYGSYSIALNALDKNAQHHELASDTLDVFGKDYLYTMVDAQGVSLIDGNLFLPLNSEGKIEGKVAIKTIPESGLKLMLVNPSKGAGNIPAPDGQPVKADQYGKATYDLSSMPSSPGGLYSSGFTVKSPGSEKGRATLFYLAMSPFPVYHYSFDTQTSADLATQFRSLTFGQYSTVEGSMPAVAGTLGAGVQLGHGHLVNQGLPDLLKGNFTVCADLQPASESNNFTLMGRPDGLMAGTINDQGQIGITAGKQSVFSHSILSQDVPFHHVCLSRSVNPEGTQSSVSIAVDGKLDVENAKLDHPDGVNTEIAAVGGYLDDEGHIIESEGKLDNLKVFNEADRMDEASSDLYVIWSCPGNGKCSQSDYLPIGHEAVKVQSLSLGGDLFLEFNGLSAASKKGLTFSTAFDVQFNGQPIQAEAQTPNVFKLTQVSAENLASLEFKPSTPESVYKDDNGKSVKAYGYTVKFASSLEGLDHPELSARLDSDRLDSKGMLHNVISLPDSQVVMHYHQTANTGDKPMRGEDHERPIQQDHFHAVDGGKIANYDPQHDIIDLNKLLSGEHKVPASVQELAALLCTREKEGSQGLIDQVLIRHKDSSGDSHCDCQSKDDPAYTVNLLDPMHQPLLVVNYDGLQHDLYPSS